MPTGEAVAISMNAPSKTEAANNAASMKSQATAAHATTALDSARMAQVASD